MNEGLLMVLRALELAAHKHAGQRRKGAAAEPYVNHVVEVALLLAQATEGRDPELVAAGLLHDILEDTKTTPEELEREFGKDVAALVQEVTDDKSLPQKERKLRQVQSAPHKTERARLIKIADKTSNLRSITSSPPVGWGARRRREYFLWGREVVDGCRGINGFLERAFDEAYSAGMARLLS